MQLKTILNRVTDYKSFVFGKDDLGGGSATAAAWKWRSSPRANGRPICSGCGKARPGYDRCRDRGGSSSFRCGGLRCTSSTACGESSVPTCGVKVERVPWAEGKSPMTTEYKWFLARWARRMSWKEVSEAFHVSWDRVYDAVKHAVSWGLEHRDLEGIEAIGVDEVQWHRGHKYQTVVYQLDEGQKRLLWIGPDRKAKTLLRFFRFLGKERTAGIAVHLQRHVAGVLEGDRQEGPPGRSRSGPLSHHATDEQGDRRSACRRGQATGGGRLRTASSKGAAGCC